MSRLIWLLLFLLIVTGACAQSITADSHQKELTAERNQKDKHFRKDKDSPIPTKERRKFKGLHYYPVNPTYRLEATFVRDSTQSPFQMRTSTSRLPMYVKYGELHFLLEGKSLVLTVYQNLDLVHKPGYEDYLFVPFTDATNGSETYGGGRYLDFRIPATNQATIDFNRAYNPYCTYSANYSCPIQPAENELPIAVRAGEKAYKAY